MSNNDEQRGRGRPEMPEEQRASSHIHLRVTASRKAAYVRAANAEGVKTTGQPMTLADWAFKHLDLASGHNEKKL